jgi:hypothetical protein
MNETRLVEAQENKIQDKWNTKFMKRKSDGIECFFFLIFILGGGIKVHSTLRPLNGLFCPPRVIMIMEKSVE